MRYRRKRDLIPKKETNGFIEFIKELFGETIGYLLLLFIFGSSVGLYIYGGIAMLILLIPFIMIIYYYVFHRNKTKIKTKNLQNFNLKSLNHISQYLAKQPNQDFEKYRIPLLKYCNLISKRFSLDELEDVVVNLNRVITDGSFDLRYIPLELKDDLSRARTEYLFQQIKIPESYITLLSPVPLTQVTVELVIQYIFQTIAKYEVNFIEQEDQYLATLLNNQI